ncbi:CDP-glycerol glycerophosphotransferase family protein [Corynebacterium renale]|uniref:CDP-glycerol glycerophosphotransferase family protein n=1 Tax=Corynebacterium renale TaxID=1724 RepID=UPI000E1BB936|nr:CDP-glycerol glycerophosphotransferase family protein [Corynebacterium renale]
MTVVCATFEDGHLICRYLLGCAASAERVQVGEVASALYFYRSRSDASSLVQSGWGIGERYDDQVRFGYLALLQQAVAQCGAVPAWLANTVLYDISWYFTEDITTRARTMWLYHQAEFKARFLELLDAIFALLPPGTDPCRPVSSTVRDAWAVKYWGKPPTGDFCQHFFDEPFAHVTYEREPRVPKGTNPLTWAERMRLRRLVTGDNRAVNLAKAVSRKARHLVKKSAKLKAQVIVNIPWVPASLKGAWVITDRVTGAGDNGEHLYRWIVDNTDHKAFFVLKRGAPGWDRLKKDGYRVLPHGSARSILAYLNAEAVISSDAVVESRNLAPAYLYGPSRAPFVFLQHGVIYNRNIKNIAGWLNTIDIDLMFTSTDAETEYVAAPDSRFRISPDRVVQVGMPRWDRLVELTREKQPGPRLTVLLMPTWFPGKDYSAWSNLANELREDYQVQVVAHPSIANELGTGIAQNVVDPRRDDFQSILAAADVLVTDYSSVLFDALTAGKRVLLMHGDGDRPIVTDNAAVANLPVAANVDEVKELLGTIKSQREPTASANPSFCADTYTAIRRCVKTMDEAD